MYKNVRKRLLENKSLNLNFRRYFEDKKRVFASRLLLFF